MKNIINLTKKELKDYFISPMAYVIIAAFIIVVSIWFLFVSGVFTSNLATMRDTFIFISQILIIVIPALTMRSWAEEKKSGTLEVVSTLPISNLELIFSKFLSCLIFILIAITLTFPIPLTLNILGNPDNGIIISSYIGLIFLSASYIVIGQFVSINSNNQIVSFILSTVFTFLIYIFGEAQFLQFMPSFSRVVLESLGTGAHYISIAKGVIDSRDILYFLSIIIILFYFIYRSLERIKKQGK